MIKHKKIPYQDYVALSEEQQLRYALAEAEEILADAEAVLNADGHWVAASNPEPDLKRAVGFGEDPGESDFD